MKVLIAKRGCFSTSSKANQRLLELGVLEAIGEEELPTPYIYRHEDKCWLVIDDNIQRSDPRLLQVFEEIGQDMVRVDDDGHVMGELCVVEIPDDVQFKVNLCDGASGEYISEVHRTWDDEGNMRIRK